MLPSHQMGISRLILDTRCLILPAQYLHIRCKIGSRTGPIAKRLLYSTQDRLPWQLMGQLHPGQMTGKGWLPMFWYATWAYQ